MMQVRPNTHGYIALMTVLIVGAASLTIALSLLLTGADSQKTTLVTQQSAQARTLATACAEEALQIIHDNTSYSGTNTLALSTGTCSYTVTVTGISTRTVDTSSAVNNVTRKIKVYVTLTQSKVSIISWQEVGDA